MTTYADWPRAILDAAEKRGYAVVAIDVRANAVTVEPIDGVPLPATEALR